MLKDFLNHLWLVDEADDAHLPLAAGTGKGISLIDFSDEIGPALVIFNYTLSAGPVRAAPVLKRCSIACQSIFEKNASIYFGRSAGL